MKKKHLILIGILSLVLFSIFHLTIRREPEFIPLPLLSGEEVAKYGINGPIYAYTEAVLIKNPPKNRALLQQLKYDYLKNQAIDLCSLDLNTTRYFLSFYRKTCCTSYFITHPEDPGGFSSYMIDEDCQDDDLGMFGYHRSKENPNMWYSSFPNDFKDTVFCNCNTMPDTLLLK
ncbi:hypothetical protein DMA11_02125 [Marinilabiliaceae bacterium JC017]|nr:hypothetical protein DMA11_02125 [Marinilabiliaceae bacterium JC017]